MKTSNGLTYTDPQGGVHRISGELLWSGNRDITVGFINVSIKPSGGLYLIVASTILTNGLQYESVALAKVNEVAAGSGQVESAFFGAVTMSGRGQEVRWGGEITVRGVSTFDISLGWTSGGTTVLKEVYRLEEI